MTPAGYAAFTADVRTGLITAGIAALLTGAACVAHWFRTDGRPR